MLAYIGIAFIILFAAGRLIIQTGDLTYFILILIYGVDGVLTICHRIMLHENLGQAHRKHAFQLMANELRMSHVVVFALAYILFMKKYYHLHEEYLVSLNN